MLATNAVTVYKSPMSLTSFYQQAVEEGEIRRDPVQLEVIRALQHIWDELLKTRGKKPAKPPKPGRKFLSLFSSGRSARKHEAVKGAYIWGGVGRGKTWVMDVFFRHVPVSEKKRMHFHHFMLYIHEALKHQSSRENPLEWIAHEIATDTRLLCIDEFHVFDIVDAMLLYGLLDALFRHGVTLVMTSNRRPDDLYLNGLQRARFLPAIGLLKQHTHVLHLDNHVDYRTLKSAAKDASAHAWEADDELVDLEIGKCFDEIANGEVHTDTEIMVQGRILPVRRFSANAVWFHFRVLCEGPRAPRDYIELAERFDYIMLSGLRPLDDEDDEDSARRFLNLIDELYDRRVQFIFSTTIPLDALYQGPNRDLTFEFQRAMSRLNEMQGDDYQQVRLAEAV